MRVDYKVTLWETAKFKDDTFKDKIIDIILNGDIDDIFDPDLGFIEVIPLHDTETIDKEYVEVFDDNDNMLLETGLYGIL